MSSKRVRLAAATALVAAAVIASVVAVAGGADGGEGSLAWKGKVEIVRSTIPTDRILYTQIENASLRDLDLEADAVEVLDADGGEVRSATRFIAAFAHGIYPWSMRDEAGDDERRRLGEIATLKPGQSIPVTVSWSVPAGGAQPEVVDFGPASLRLP